MNKTKTLLEIAKESDPGSRKDRIDSSTLEERLDVALAYFSREITAAQARAGLNCTANGLCNKMSLTLFMAARRGLITITKKESQ